MIKISVVMPVFNTRAIYLRDAVLTVFMQEYPCHELIIVNDGSTRKETLDELNSMRDFNLMYLKIIDQKNKKISGALNTGIRHMTGDWWAGCGSDDTWYSNKLKDQVAFLEANPEAKVVYCDWDYINANGEKIGHFQEPEFRDRMAAGRHIVHDYFGTWGGMLVHKSVFDEVGLYNESFPTREDYEMNIRILNKFMMYRVPKTLFTYRLHHGQLTIKNDKPTQNKYTELARAMAIEYFGEKNP